MLSEQMARLNAAADAPSRNVARSPVDCGHPCPVGNRLGIWQLKWQLEDLAFRYLQPETYRRMPTSRRERTGRESFIEDAKRKLRVALGEADTRPMLRPGKAHLQHLAKDAAKRALDFSELYDIRAIRLLVDDVSDCYAPWGSAPLWTPWPRNSTTTSPGTQGNDYARCTRPCRRRRSHARGADSTHAMHEHAEWAWRRIGVTGGGKARLASSAKWPGSAIARDPRGRRRVHLLSGSAPHCSKIAFTAHPARRGH